MKKFLTAALVLLLFSSAIFAKTEFNDKTYPAKIKVTASALNVRSGPSTGFTKVGIVYKNQICDCIGKIGEYYVLHLDNDTVGVVSGKYVSPYYPQETTTKPPTEKTDTTIASVDEIKMLTLINQDRRKEGLKELTFDNELIRIARLKSQDMEKEGYFAHTSPNYGTPFEMMKSFGVTYKTAGENLAGHSSVESAHKALMNSAGHRKNILNSSFSKIGIGIEKSNRYGLLITELFVGY